MTALEKFMEDAPELPELTITPTVETVQAESPTPTPKKNELPLTDRERKWRDEALYWQTRAEARELVAKHGDFDSLLLGLEYYADAGNWTGEESRMSKDGGSRARLVLDAVRLKLRHAQEENQNA